MASKRNREQRENRNTKSRATSYRNHESLPSAVLTAITQDWFPGFLNAVTALISDHALRFGAIQFFCANLETVGYALEDTRAGASSDVVDSTPGASRVRVITVMSSSCPKATAASVACLASGWVAISARRRSKLKISPAALRASSKPSV